MMNQYHRPDYPGALTPAQRARRTARRLATVLLIGVAEATAIVALFYWYAVTH